MKTYTHIFTYTVKNFFRNLKICSKFSGIFLKFYQYFSQNFDKILLRFLKFSWNFTCFSWLLLEFSQKFYYNFSTLMNFYSFTLPSFKRFQIFPKVFFKFYQIFLEILTKKILLNVCSSFYLNLLEFA